MHLVFCLLASLCHFLPPPGWDCAAPKSASEPLAIGFIGKGKREIPPSINLAVEPTDLSLKDYIKAVKALHESDLHVAWKDLGEFTFKAGKGRLGEVCTSCPFGEMKVLQGIFLKDGCAYILTGAALKEEFTEHRAAILASLRTLTLSPDLFSAIADSQSRETLKKRFDQFASLESPDLRQKEWESLQKYLPKEFADLGSYWHYLALREGYQRIFWTEITSSLEYAKE